jgi:hypothetical protein
MARYNEHKCFTCGQSFDYCRHCAVTPVVYKAEGFCSENCSHIFNILSKHGSHLATAEETLEELKNYDVTNVTESIQAHIDSLQPEKVEVKTETNVKAVKEVETKKNKFRTQE